MHAQRRFGEWREQLHEQNSENGIGRLDRTPGRHAPPAGTILVHACLQRGDPKMWVAVNDGRAIAHLCRLRGRPAPNAAAATGPTASYKHLQSVDRSFT
eukprot:COSAG01_NODE_4764_length_4753_cov_8.984757_5_plen_99_part_00